MNKKRSGALGIVLLLASVAAMTAPMLAQKESSPMPKVGEMAPDFTLMYFDGSDRKPIKLSDYRGKKNVIVAFYVFAFTGG